MYVIPLLRHLCTALPDKNNLFNFDEFVGAAPWLALVITVLFCDKCVSEKGKR